MTNFKNPWGFIYSNRGAQNLKLTGYYCSVLTTELFDVKNNVLSLKNKNRKKIKNDQFQNP